MNIGIISDTHDDLSSLKNAIKLFKEGKVQYVIHAGIMFSQE
jgi:predicted phosphodiesterase